MTMTATATDGTTTFPLDEGVEIEKAQEITGKSERSIYRLQARGLVRTISVPEPGKRNKTLYNVQDLQRFAPGPKQLTAPEPEPEDEDSATVLPPSELRHKLFLTQKEAVEYTGLGIGLLRARITRHAWGPRGSLVFRRSDLDGFFA